MSTSCIGLCIYDTDLKTYILLDYIEFTGCDTLWKKGDRVRKRFSVIEHKIDHLFIEDIAIMYSPGLSSAGVIAKLAGFNCLVSFLARERFGVDPVHISPAQARKLCGLKMKSKANSGGKSHKQQTYDAIMSTDLAQHDFPRKKVTKKNHNPDVVSWAYDIVDSYVISKAASRIIS